MNNHTGKEMSEHKQFGDFPAQYTEYNDASIVVVPVPYEKTTTYIRGAGKGPDAIIKASPNLEFYDIETNTEVYKQGISTDSPVIEESSAEKMIQDVNSRIDNHVKNKKFTVLLGVSKKLRSYSSMPMPICVMLTSARSITMPAQWHVLKNSHLLSR
ncbi:MAG: arginase family protein [Planctomycetota bacterium]|jgi:arginase family enzyme